MTPPPLLTPPAVSAYPRRWAALAVLLVAEAMNLLDATIMTVAAPAIHADLGGPVSDIQWYGAAYTLPFAVLLIAGGRLGDIVGRRRVFAIGVAGFGLASLACVFAPAAGPLIAARAVQGAAAALVVPQTIGLIRAMFTGDELARAMGSIGPVMGLAAVCGPVAGAVLTHVASWRAVFLVNVPLAVAVLLATPLLREDRSARRPRLDLVGTVLVAGAVGLLTYPLIQAADYRTYTTTWAASTALLAVLVLQQRRRSRRALSPLVEPSLFADRGFSAALLCSLLFFAVVGGLMLVVVIQLQLRTHVGVLAAGLTLLPWSCAMALASWTAGTRLVPRYGARMMYVGLGALLAGVLGAIAVYAAAPAAGYPWPLLAALAVCGLGQGLFAVPFFTTALHRVRPHETGSAAGLLNAVQQLGSTLGVALLGSVFFGAGVEGAFWVAAGLLAVAGAAVAGMSARPRAREGAPSSTPERTTTGATGTAGSGAPHRGVQSADFLGPE
ncbi:MFS transporter [Streptomyces sp. R21]|uniref:MFS transporter n=1 Tax=Streptomyces sp. R21 TaxID=3238627 RepID=A0AB39P5V8_9ACTN